MIKIIKGDVTSPIQKPAIICHIVNNVNKWGAGFVLALSRKWSFPEKVFRDNKQELGKIRIIQVDTEIYVCNMCAQDGIGTNRQRVSYADLAVCLEKVDQFAQEREETLHMPYLIGCGLGGGEVDKIMSLIKNICKSDVYLYKFKKGF